ncbi:hypothetical protein AJ80_01886 [Polytolypa hystricis UAMH7299]|uniref:TRIP4/RQT4 C2HC5-type zinc finger domain-containing protein n=1 Tax=Polytolypa hystricis (strain UAMH7299) TaxID=1447883 RepID=A0A2B7YZT3_POLH7|nr:hypothetical protein AJ80_01886 [Polytolypa hystricis UAMH7299]
MSSQLQTWALPRLSNLLPLDEESLVQIITYTDSLSKEASADHLKNLLGDSPAALEFISSFNSRRNTSGANAGEGTRTARRTQDDGVAATFAQSGANTRQTQQKRKKGGKAPLHSAGPVRRPDGYGDVTGGYVKTDKGGDYMASFGAGSTSTPSSGPSRTQSPAPSKTPSNAAPRNPPSASGPLISDYLPNVKSKTVRSSAATSSRHTPAASTSSSPSRKPRNTSSTTTPTATTTTTTTNNIADLTSAIAALEVSTNPTLLKGQKPRKCTCNALIHPLFTPAPNCLKCGKITCALEGLQPCSFCGTPLLSDTEIQDMIRELRAERGNEKMRVHNESLHQRNDRGPGAPSPSAEDSKLQAAKAHRDKLLAFQAQNAQRTRVLDEAADFDMPTFQSTQWMSPAQRALALKKQQRIMREIEEKNRPEWEKKNMVMSLDIKGGKVVKTYQKAEVESGPSGDANDAEDMLEETGNGASAERTGGAFGHNPLLAGGGLVRPVWEPAGGKDAAQPKERRQTWRRVQDDNSEDNERWILDGGRCGFDGDGCADKEGYFQK